MARSKPRFFFKVFFPDQSATHLRIPPAFWEHIGAESGNRVSLKGPSGSTWRADLVRKPDGFFFQGGWRDFAADHSLATGDFLLFRYDGCSRFKVLVFDSTACEKKKALLVRPSCAREEEVNAGGQHWVSEEEEVSEEDEEDDNKPLVHFARKRLNGVVKRKWGSDPSKTSKFGSTTGKAHPLQQQQQALSLTTHLLVPKQEIESSPSSLSVPGGEKKIRKRRRRVPTDSFTIRLKTVNNQPMAYCYSSGQVTTTSPCSVEKSSSTSKALECVDPDEQLPSIYRLGSLISQRRQVTEEEVKRTVQRAMEFKSENPFTLAVMQDSYVYTSFLMCVPSWFAKAHLPKSNTILTLTDPSGTPWKVTYISYNNHGALSGGWCKFSYTNNLEKYDVCVFELIEENHIKVHIYRVVEELTPLIRRCRRNLYL